MHKHDVCYIPTGSVPILLNGSVADKKKNCHVLIWPLLSEKLFKTIPAFAHEKILKWNTSYFGKSQEFRHQLDGFNKIMSDWKPSQ